MAFNLSIISFSNRYFMTLAGIPTAMAKLGMSFVTIAPAPIIAPSPILTPPIIIAFVPIQTSLPIVVLLNSSKELTSVQLVPVPFLFAVKIGDVEIHFNE